MPRNDDDDRYDDRPRSRPKKSNGTKIAIIVLLIVGLGGGLVVIGGYFGLMALRDNADQKISANNLKQIGLAYHNYHDTYGVCVNDTYNEAGEPLLSWRVYLLPYIEEDNLYRQFRLDEPWNGPNNSRLIQYMPRVYATPNERSSRQIGTKTYYRGFTHAGAVFEKRKAKIILGGNNIIPDGPDLSKITDGLSNTIVVVEAGEAVEWSKPDDFDGSEGKPFPKLGGVRPSASSFSVLMGDGSIKTIRKNTPDDVLRKLITFAGNDDVTLNP